VRTLTGHPHRPSPIAGRVDVAPYAFDDPDALTHVRIAVDAMGGDKAPDEVVQGAIEWLERRLRETA